MMKHYHIYVFTQDECPPCQRLKQHVSGLTEAQQAELDFVPIRTAAGQRTCLAEDLNVEQTPTLVVVDHRSLFVIIVVVVVVVVVVVRV